MTMKNEQKSMIGTFMMLVGLIWAACRTIPNVRYRYDHPELTDTQLQLIFLSSLTWWDAIPPVLAVFGMILLFRANK